MSDGNNPFTNFIEKHMRKGRKSIRAMRDFERHLKEDVLLSESLVVKKVDLGETYAERVKREETEYARSTGRCGLSFERLIGNLLD